MVKEAFIVGQNLNSINIKGYDESNELAITVMEFKASMAKLQKIKQQVSVNIGDQEAFDKVLREIVFTSQLTTKMKELLQSSNSSGNHNKTDLSEDTSKKTKQKMKDQLTLTEYSGIPELMCVNEVL